MFKATDKQRKAIRRAANDPEYRAKKSESMRKYFTEKKSASGGDSHVYQNLRDLRQVF